MLIIFVMTKFFLPIIIILLMTVACAPPKGDDATVHKLDTLTSVMRTDTGVFVKIVYRLDERETTMELRRARGNGDHEPYLRYAYGYDSLGHKILSICSAYNRQKQDFEHVSMEEYEYDDEGMTISTISVEQFGKWKAKERTGSTLDARGNVTALETYELIGDKDWKIKTKHYFKYDNYNNIIEKTDYVYDEKGEWSPVEKVQREYNKTKMVLEIVSGPAPDNQWAEKSKAEYEYDLGGHCTQLTSYLKKWGKWVNNVKTEYQFDATGNMLECSTYFWNEKSGRWVFQDKEEF